MTTQIEIEEKRTELVNLQGENVQKEADFRAKAVIHELAAYTDIDSEKLRALALLRLGEHAEKIGNLTITPELLAGLIR